MTPLEQRTIAKVTARLVPFLIVCFFVAYLDRVNVSFAALTMNKDLGLSDSAFGFGAGIFFLAYFLFEVPSNLFLERVGARKWIARIMFTWGVCSGGMAFINGATGFYAVRVLLGIAEAGFFPGVIFYLTLWFPSVYRARIIGYFMAAIPLSTVIGAPVSGLLLGLDGFVGLKGWQWLFILEAAAGADPVRDRVPVHDRSTGRRHVAHRRKSAPGWSPVSMTSVDSARWFAATPRCRRSGIRRCWR